MYIVKLVACEWSFQHLQINKNTCISISSTHSFNRDQHYYFSPPSKTCTLAPWLIKYIHSMYPIWHPYILMWSLTFAICFLHLRMLLSGVPDLFDRNKILSGGDLSHYQVPHCIRVFFILFDLCLFITIFNFILNYVPIVTFWIFTYHKIWILFIIFCFIWNYWIIYFLTCLEVFWSVVS